MVKVNNPRNMPKSGVKYWCSRRVLFFDAISDGRNWHQVLFASFLDRV